MDGKLHSHAFDELKEGFVQMGKVIVDVGHKGLFKNYETYDEYHIVVGREEFEANGGIDRFVAIRKKRRTSNESK